MSALEGALSSFAIASLKAAGGSSSMGNSDAEGQRMMNSWMQGLREAQGNEDAFKAQLARIRADIKAARDHAAALAAQAGGTSQGGGTNNGGTQGGNTQGGGANNDPLGIR
jgi:hypothetical protein